MPLGEADYESLTPIFQELKTCTYTAEIRIFL